MKRTFILLIMTILSLFNLQAQSPNDVLNLLIQNKTITAMQADSIRAEAALRQQETDKARKWFPLNVSRQLSLSGYLQFRYQNLDEPGKTDGFDIRRARLDVRGAVSPYWTYRLQTDFATAPKILDAYGECKLDDRFVITFGQFKIPFSSENLTSSNKLEMIDRSQVVEAMVARGKDVLGNHNGRDIGVQVGGSLIKYQERFLLDYRLGVFNGAGINGTDANEPKDIAGRIVVHPLKGLDIGGAYYLGYDAFGTPVKNQNRTRTGAEISYEYSLFSFKSEYISGKDGTITRNGWYVQAGYYFIPQKLQFLLKYDTYDPDDKTDDNISTQITGVLNYNFNSWVRMQAGYALKSEESKQVNNNIGSVQIQIGF